MPMLSCDEIKIMSRVGGEEYHATPDRLTAAVRKATQSTFVRVLTRNSEETNRWKLASEDVSLVDISDTVTCNTLEGVSADEQLHRLRTRMELSLALFFHKNLYLQGKAVRSSLRSIRVSGQHLKDVRCLDSHDLA